jgi:hypothetical protein
MGSHDRHPDHVHVHHHVECRHGVEIDVWPAEAVVYFLDERDVDPINTQARFDVTLYNTSTSRAVWSVQNLTGGLGAGSIDSTGLYAAPNKGMLPSGHSEVIVATALDDPTRRAYAIVTLVGEGPRPSLPATIEVLPRRATLYNADSFDNDFIDHSNNQQLFRSTIQHSASPTEWLVDGTVQAGTSPWFIYRLTGSGPEKTVRITARLQADHAVSAEAIVTVLNYDWPVVPMI